MLEAFSISIFSFLLSVTEDMHLPRYKGSTLRGGFGVAFKRIVCTVRNRYCNECILSSRCVYCYIFETAPPADSGALRNYRNIPHPFVIEPPLDEREIFGPGDEISFRLILVGRAVEYLPYFIYAFEELGRIGIGRGRGRFRLADVSHLNAGAAHVIYNGETKRLESFPRQTVPVHATMNAGASVELIRLNFITPARIVINNDLVVKPEFHQLTRNLLRRLSNLSYFHCGNRLDLDFRGIIDLSMSVEMEDNALEWKDWERYSSRQKGKMKMGGFVGAISFRGTLADFIPLLRVGELVHIGKGTGFGLGKYTVTIS